MIPLKKITDCWHSRIAICSNNQAYSYADLLGRARSIAYFLLNEREDLQEARVAFMIPPGFDYVAVQWGIWMAGGIAVPLCLTHPPVEIEHVIDNAECQILISDKIFEATLMPMARQRKLRTISFHDISPEQKELTLPKISANRAAMILYTSGTTTQPKGVVITHGNIEVQVNAMVEAWGWSEKDRILNVLPLHHVHGITNVVTTALFTGACVDFLPKFDASEVWQKFMEGKLTLFMAVPTIYYRLIDYWEKAPKNERSKMSDSCRKMRLMVSGSAALPVTILTKWEAISGHTLLERYGMTEIGMALSNPLNGERRPGYVGKPMPGVKVKLVDEHFNEVNAGETGEILVKGSNVFSKYWKEPEITRTSFHEGWFKTGDMACLNGGYYKIMGRSSVDIIKSGGYKISALEIEEVLRTHPHIKECAVVGIEDEQWGEVVAAMIVGGELSQEKLSDWLSGKLAPYKIPRKLMSVNGLPRNALGKVVKPEVKKHFN